MIELIPNWHPVFVHFTVALLSLSVLLYLLAGLSLPQQLRHDWHIVARWLLWFGAGFAVATVATGWLAYNSVAHDDLSHGAMTDHRNWAIATSVPFITLALWSLWRRVTGRAPARGIAGTVFLSALAAGGVLLASTAWRGGELVYRHGLGVLSLPQRPVTEPARVHGAPTTAILVEPPTVDDHHSHKH